PRPPVVWQDSGPLALAADLTAERLSGYASAKSRVVRDGTKARDVRGSVMATQTETSSAEVKLTRLQLLGLIEGLETALVSAPAGAEQWELVVDTTGEQPLVSIWANEACEGEQPVTAVEFS